MLSRGAAANRRRERAWRCTAIGLIAGSDDIEPEDHVCTLAKGHYGPHLCWCGWRFEPDRFNWHQVMLPEPKKDRAT